MYLEMFYLKLYLGSFKYLVHTQQSTRPVFCINSHEGGNFKQCGNIPVNCRNTVLFIAVFIYTDKPLSQPVEQ